MSDDPEKLTAALEALEAERERRIEAKVADDKAIRQPLIIVLGGSEDDIDAKVESARAARLAELRGGGEKREVVFDCQVIVTGVPRSPKTYEAQPRTADDKPDYTSHLKTYGTKPPPPLPKPPAEAKAPPDPQRVRTEVRQCKNDDDPGEIVEGYYDIRNGEVFVWTAENGARPLGHAPIRPGDDPAVVARRLLREKVGRGVSLPKTRSERIDGVVRQGSDTQQCSRSGRSAVYKVRLSQAKRESARHYNRSRISQESVASARR